MPKEQNGYGEFGTLMHMAIELIINGEDGYSFYVDNMNIENIPNGKFEEYSVVVPEFLRAFKPTSFHGEIVGTEKEFSLDIDSENEFTGIIDLILKSDNSYTLVDWKISKIFNKITLKEKQKQLYLYSNYVYQTYGVYPNKMFFYFPAVYANKKYIEINWLEADYKEAYNWMLNEINSVNTTERKPNTDNWIMCNRLCAVKNHCQYTL